MHPASTSIFGANDTVYVPANGVWAVTLGATCSPNQRATNAGYNAVSGAFLFILQRNGNTVGASTVTFNAADYPNATFAVFASIRFPFLEAYAGDQLKILSQQSGVNAGASTTTTDNPLTAAATTVNVASTTGMFAADYLRVGDETILIGTVASGTQLTGCTRGYHGTTAASHPNASPAFTGRGVYGTGSSATPSILVVERKWAI
jgi:hypothetical protein